MATLKNFAKEYEPPKTKNITELEEVRTDVEIKRTTKTKKIMEDGKEIEEEYSYFYIEVNDEQYRVPNSVLEQLKGLLEEKPDLEKVKVKKTGEGLNTKY